VVVKLSPAGNKTLIQAAANAGCSKGEMIERLLGLFYKPGKKKATAQADGAKRG
jgi:hypothetical protein